MNFVIEFTESLNWTDLTQFMIHPHVIFNRKNYKITYMSIYKQVYGDVESELKY